MSYGACGGFGLDLFGVFHLLDGFLVGLADGESTSADGVDQASPVLEVLFCVCGFGLGCEFAYQRFAGEALFA